MLIKLDQIEHGKSIQQSVADLQSEVNSRKTEFATDEDIQNLIPEKNQSTLVLTPTYSEQILLSDYDENMNDKVDSTGKLPWDVIDFKYVTSAKFLFDKASWQLSSTPKLINTQNVRSFYNAFSAKSSLINIQAFDNLESCKNLYGAFNMCNNLENVPDFPKISYEADCSWMFGNCESLQKAPAIAGYMGKTSYMFDGCRKLVTVPEYDLSSCKEMKNMFYNCESLTGEFPWEIDLSSIKDVSNMSSMFGNTGITKITFKNVRKALNPDEADNTLNGSSLASHIGLPNAEIIVKNYLNR